MPKRIQRKRTKGWRMPEGTVYVGRPGAFGNPFDIATAVDTGFVDSVDSPDARRFVADCFSEWLADGPHGRDWWQGPENDRRKAVIRARLHELRGKDLCCWCPPESACHADVLLELANAPPPPPADTMETGNG